MVIGLAAALQGVSAGDITGTVTLKGTPPKEKDITPVMEDANCSAAASPMTMISMDDCFIFSVV